MAMITLTNDFHGTETTVRIADDGTISASQERRAARALCASDCQCSGYAGVRGGAYAVTPADANGERFYVEARA